MDWENVDLNDSYERERNILDPYSFDTLLLEIHCNIPNINRETVRKQFEESLRINIQGARDIFEANLNNIVKTALKERE